MTKVHRHRLYLSLLLLVGITTAVGLILFALKQNINLFYTPTEIQEQKISLLQTIRVGGMVKQGSIQRGQNLDIQFTLTDYHQDVKIRYSGILPDLFREGQGVVVLGELKSDGCFEAHQVLAKHDENYMPSEVKAAIEKGVQKNVG